MNQQLTEHLRFYRGARRHRHQPRCAVASTCANRNPAIEPSEPSDGRARADGRHVAADSGHARALRRRKRWTSIRSDIGDCTRCKLHTLGRRQIVFGVGNPSADLMFVGEAPGADEDIQGIPFVGRAGQLLTKIIEAIELRREDVYIANVIKCRPPDNRNPEPDEVETCEPFLFQQIDAIKPKVIVALGTFAAQDAAQDRRTRSPGCAAASTTTAARS